MSKKSKAKRHIIRQSFVSWGSNKEVFRRDIIILDGHDGIFIKEKPHKHYHVYTDREGKKWCHIKNEKTGIRKPSNKF
jgi:trehalose utilization protein